MKNNHGQQFNSRMFILNLNPQSRRRAGEREGGGGEMVGKDLHAAAPMDQLFLGPATTACWHCCLPKAG